MARPTNPDRGKLEIAASPEQIRRWEAAARAVNLPVTIWLRVIADAAVKDSAKGKRR